MRRMLVLANCLSKLPSFYRPERLYAKQDSIRSGLDIELTKAFAVLRVIDRHPPLLHQGRNQWSLCVRLGRTIKT